MSNWPAASAARACRVKCRALSRASTSAAKSGISAAFSRVWAAAATSALTLPSRRLRSAVIRSSKVLGLASNGPYGTRKPAASLARRSASSNSPQRISCSDSSISTSVRRRRAASLVGRPPSAIGHFLVLADQRFDLGWRVVVEAVGHFERFGLFDQHASLLDVAGGQSPPGVDQQGIALAAHVERRRGRQRGGRIVVGHDRFAQQRRLFARVEAARPGQAGPRHGRVAPVQRRQIVRIGQRLARGSSRSRRDVAELRRRFAAGPTWRPGRPAGPAGRAWAAGYACPGAWRRPDRGGPSSACRRRGTGRIRPSSPRPARSANRPSRNGRPRSPGEPAPAACLLRGDRRRSPGRRSLRDRTGRKPEARRDRQRTGDHGRRRQRQGNGDPCG